MGKLPVFLDDFPSHKPSSEVRGFPSHPSLTPQGYLSNIAKDCVSMFKGLPPRQIELLSSAIAEQTVPDRGEMVLVYTTLLVVYVLHNT